MSILLPYNFNILRIFKLKVYLMDLTIIFLKFNLLETTVIPTANCNNIPGLI